MKNTISQPASYIGFFIALITASLISIIGSFYLLAIAFNTPFDKLRGSFIPVYIGIIAGAIISTLISRRWPYLITAIVITFPVITLFWITFQNISFGIDLLFIIALSCSWSYYASSSIFTKKTAEQGSAHQPTIR